MKAARPGWGLRLVSSPVRAVLAALVAAVALVPFVGLGQVPKEGLTLWLDAESLGSIRDGSVFDVWRNRSPVITSDELTAQPGNEPTFKAGILNGKPVVRFDGTNDLFTGSSWETYISPTQFTWFVVFNAAAVRTDGSSYWNNSGILGEAGGNLGLGLKGADSPSYLRAGFEAPPYSTGGKWVEISCVPGKWQVAVVRFDANSPTNLYLHSQSESEEGIVVGAPVGSLKGTMTSPLRLGQSASGFGNLSFQGDVAEVLIYNRSLSRDEIRGVESYFSSKFNISRLKAK
ncbi:MAG: LamG-like jellyroll fold domain-containing protein [Terrimicrobiaceae bacterium]